MNERSDDFDVSLPSSSTNELLKGLIIRRTAVGITGTVLLDGANQHFLRPQHLGPTDGSGEEMSIAERDVGHRDRFANWLGFWSIRYRDRGVSQRRASDLAEDVDSERQEPGEMQCLSHRAGALQFTAFSALPIAE